MKLVCLFPLLTTDSLTVSQMRNLLEEREKERTKPEHDIKRLIKENEALGKELQASKLHLVREKKTSGMALKDAQARAKTEKKIVEKKINIIQGQLADKEKQNAALSTEVSNLGHHLSKEKFDRIETGKKAATLHKQAVEELQLRLEAEKNKADTDEKLKAYQEETEKKLQKAKELFDHHKELLELHCKDSPENLRNSILKALGEEFGGLEGRD